MKKKRVWLLLATLISTILCNSSFADRQRVSFNDGWRFARFGPMPDGSRVTEPGGEIASYRIKCSSEAIERNGEAYQIMDDKLGTCWNSAGKSGEWVAIEFEQEQTVASVWIKWGFGGAPGLTVLAKVNGSWQAVATLADNKREGDIKVNFDAVKTQAIKIELTRIPPKGWPRIAEVRLYDQNGKKLKFKNIKDTGKPAYQADFDDSSWESIRLPHDWAIKGPFDNRLDNTTGALPWKGIGWYRKTFEMDKNLKGQRIYLDFDGAMAHAQVYLNGKLIGGWPYGYSSFRVDLTDAIKFGDKNTVAVRLDTIHWGSRWYPGAGIYRNVWLVNVDPIHVAHWGAGVTTPVINDEKAVAKFEVTLNNETPDDADITARIKIKAPNGRKELTAPITTKVKAGKSKVVELSTDILQPELWNLTEPNLYSATVILKTQEKVVDQYQFKFGIRKIEFGARSGFKLNGNLVKIQGVCNHHDLGPLGAAINYRALERQLEILKNMGCNAIRTSHNPPAPELLDLCDKMGLLVMDEAFDCWKRGKRPFDYGVLFDEWHEKDLRALILRDRNHPSVIMWSIGNEVPDQHNAKMAKELSSIVHKYDSTRPVVLCSNSGHVGVSDVTEALDIMGYNYNLGYYGKFFKYPKNANRPLIGSETASCISSRGAYFFPIEKNKRSDFQITSYDIDRPGWGCSPDKQFEILDKYPAVLGEFVWTGFDYLGEPTPYNRDSTVLLNFSDPAERARQKKKLDKLGHISMPSRSSYFGIIDLCGFPKDRFYSYQARWRPELPMVHILPHWNWPERIGKITPVHIYSSGDEVELFLNGKSLGRKKKEAYTYRLRWDDVKYQPGELHAVAYKNGKIWAEEIVKTSDKPAKLSLTADHTDIKPDGKDLSFITLQIVDKDGLTVPNANNTVEFSINGPGEIIATGNGDATDRTSFASKKRAAFNGAVLAVIRSIPGKSGKIILEAKSANLESAKIEITSKP